MKFFCLNKISKVGLNRLEEDDVIVNDINEADVILVRSMNMLDMELPNNIVAIARAGVGVNNIPLEKMAEKGVVVFNTPGANANAVKELVLCGLLLGSRGIIEGINWVNNNKDNKNLKTDVEKQKSKYAGNEIKGKKIGVIGLGGIGVIVANACYDLGMTVYGYDPFLSINNAMLLTRSVKYVTDISVIYKECDYISIHIPLNNQTQNLVTDGAINTMKKGVVILNFSREELVDNKALKENLDNGKIYKYITDFPSYDIMQYNNVIALPHLGASTEEAEDNCAYMAVEQAINYFKHGNINNSVNYPRVDGGYNITNYRVLINHKNIVGMINEFTKLIALDNGNIINMINKSLANYAYTILDVDNIDKEILIESLYKINGVLKVRVI